MSPSPMPVSASPSAKAVRQMVDLTTPILVAAVALPLIGQTYLAVIGESGDSLAMPTLERVSGTRRLPHRVC